MATVTLDCLKIGWPIYWMWTVLDIPRCFKCLGCGYVSELLTLGAKSTKVCNPEAGRLSTVDSNGAKSSSLHHHRHNVPNNSSLISEGIQRSRSCSFPSAKKNFPTADVTKKRPNSIPAEVLKLIVEVNPGKVFSPHHGRSLVWFLSPRRKGDPEACQHILHFAC